MSIAENNFEIPVRPTASWIYTALASEALHVSQVFEESEISSEQAANKLLKEKEAFARLEEEDEFTYALYQLMKIEKYVENIISTEEMDFKFVETPLLTNRLRRVPTQLYRNPDEILKWIECYSTEYKYSELVNIFFYCVKSIDNSKKNLTELIQQIRLKAQSKSAIASAYVRKKRSTRNIDSVTKYLCDILDYSNSRCEVIRMNMGYDLLISRTVTPEQAKEDFKKFLNNRRGKPTLFKNLVGYIWRMEYGVTTGIFFHVVWIFKNDKGQMKLQNLANDIGEYWIGFLKARAGTFQDCANGISGTNKIGVGEICRNNNKQIRTLQFIATYLAQKDEYFSFKKLGNGKMFGMGQAKQTPFR